MIAAVRTVVRVSALAALFVAGLTFAAAVASGGGVANPTTTTTTTAGTEATTTTTTTETTTTETTTTTTPVTSIETTTVEHTTTRVLPLPGNLTTTTPTSGTDEGTAAWVWVLIAILAVGLVALIVLLARRGDGGSAAGVPVDARRRQLDAAVGSWFAQGWAIESQTADSAVLRRGAEAMLVSVDEAGHVSTRPLPPPA
jgi:hypothetical protein